MERQDRQAKQTGEVNGQDQQDRQVSGQTRQGDRQDRWVDMTGRQTRKRTDKTSG